MRDAVATPRVLTFSASQRVKVRRDFVRLNESAKRVHTPHFVLQVGASGARSSKAVEGVAVGTGASPADALPCRLGITVTRKVANAVGRNRVKRVVREVFRRNPELFPAGVDIVFVARASAPDAGYLAVREEVARARGALAHAAERVRRGAAA